MKKIITLSILFFSCLPTFAQKQTEKEIKGLLCHKWKLDYVMAGDQRLPKPPGIENTFLDIKTNGTLIAGELNNQKKGKWRYDHKTKTLTTETDKKILKHELKKITKTGLILKSSIEGIVLDIVMKKAD
jgi:hypothetical protein